MSNLKQSKIPEELHDFRNFVFLVWKHLGLPEPTKVQYDICNWLQHGDKRRLICAFRGVGKSYLTSAYVVWSLLMNHDTRVLVVSASKPRADDFSSFTQRLIHEMPLLLHLAPRKGQRDAKIAFDIGPSPAAHAPSVKSVGITGQITGSRADIIVADDIESLNNSATQQQREKLTEWSKEFEAVIKPGGEIIFLGTPQSEMSIYNDLPERGYTSRFWPARYPDSELMEFYGERLSPEIAAELEQEEAVTGHPTDPQRFDDEDLMEREMSYGRSGFALQFMLDTTLSDLNLYPLKLSDLVVHSINGDEAPEKIIWASSPDLRHKDLPNVGFTGDCYYRPMAVAPNHHPFTGCVMSIDPAGKGQDETAYSIVKMLNGYLYVHECRGLQGGYSEEVITTLAQECAKHKVNLVLVESNFGQGMFTELMKPIFRKIHPVAIEEVRHSKQKEARIIDTMEPVMNQHRLVMDPQFIERDFRETESDIHYGLMYQMSRITRQKRSLVHDDRLDSLSMAVGYWVEQMGQDPDENIRRHKAALLDRELKDFMATAVGKKPRKKRWFSLKH